MGGPLLQQGNKQAPEDRFPAQERTTKCQIRSEAQGPGPPIPWAALQKPCPVTAEARLRARWFRLYLPQLNQLTDVESVWRLVSLIRRGFRDGTNSDVPGRAPAGGLSRVKTAPVNQETRNLREPPTPL